ncbi:MAG: ARPP-1 family domain-containing protein [Candidatus Jordarchaeum sp.]|uniref:ARPP-1 family domain-containing protein n=1 Tax=Candidatus Jordarchaeum sp. TaxID=2823881 RepID=UPI004049E2E4
MKSASVNLVESFFDNPLILLKLGEAQKHGNMVVLPLIMQGSILDFICVNEAEEKGKIKIVETDSVQELKVINNSDKQVLIPFGVTVHGGKQDRTIWEPILIPVGSKHNILQTATIGGKSMRELILPAKCIEQSRWSYTKGEDFKAHNLRLNPQAAFMAMSPGGQSAVWDEIQKLRKDMKLENYIAPTQSYLEITKANEKKIDSLVNRFENLEGQCGVAVFINGELMGTEFYGNPQAWRSISKEILRAFVVEAIRDEEKPVKEVKDHYHNIFIETLRNIGINLTVRKGIGLGDVVEFKSEDSKWRGITLIHENTMVQFYLVSREDKGKIVRHQEDVIQYRQQQSINQPPFRIQVR